MKVSCEAIIIGAGIAGISVAYHLAKKGIKPVIIEKETIPGKHATSQNAALFSSLDLDPLIFELSEKSYIFLLKEHLITQTGAFFLGDSGNTQSDFHSYWNHDLLKTVAQKQTKENAAQCYSMLEHWNFSDALYCEKFGVIDTHGQLMWLLKNAQRLGSTIYYQQEVQSIDSENRTICGVSTKDAYFETSLVINASGAWAGQVGRIDVIPYKRHIFISQTKESHQLPKPYIWDIDHQLYIRKESESILASPCDQEPTIPCEPLPDENGLHRLMEKSICCKPLFDNFAVRRQWAGLRTFAHDKKPIIRQDDTLSGLYHLAGLGGHGMSLGYAIGEYLVQKICFSMIR